MPTKAGTTERETVPALAAALVDLLNSRPYGGLADKLDSPESAESILRPFGQEHGLPDRHRLDLVRTVRTTLLDLLGPDGSPEAERAWEALSTDVEDVTFRHHFGPGRVELHQVTGDPVVGRITQAVASLVAEGSWSRLRACANEECREVFYDTTRSRTRRWHSYEDCGNRANVSAYRARTAERITPASAPDSGTCSQGLTTRN